MTVQDIDVRQHRKTDHQIEPLFVERWSPRAMTGEPVSRELLMRLFEAARWAPSAFNRQPWRFVYAQKDSQPWPKFFDLLGEFNQLWCNNAGALVVICSQTETDEGKPMRTHSFDTGAAWQNLCLQGSRMGLVVHGMQGFDYDRATTEIGLPDGFAVEAMCAIGHPGEVDSLPERMRKQEIPNGRNPAGQFSFEGSF